LVADFTRGTALTRGYRRHGDNGDGVLPVARFLCSLVIYNTDVNKNLLIDIDGQLHIDRELRTTAKSAVYDWI